MGWSTDAEIWIAASTFLLFVVTTALACFTYFLWRSTGKLVEGSDETAKRQLRAYLSVEFIPQEWGALHKEGLGRWKLNVHNTGQSPAKEVMADATYAVLRWPLTNADHRTLLSQLPHSEGFDDSKTVIHPGQKSFLRIRAKDDISQDEINQAISGTDYRLHIFGKITYKDIFGESRFTTFCVTVYGGRDLGWIFGPPRVRATL